MSEELSFYSRFAISVNKKVAEDKFINRVYTGIFDNYFAFFSQDIHDRTVIYNRMRASLAFAFGSRYYSNDEFDDFIGSSFTNCLQAIEVFYEIVDEENGDVKAFEEVLEYILKISEIDLGIEWRDGQFWRTGAKVLDEKLVNENLKWVHDKGHTNIYEPFEKALVDYSESISRPEKLQNVVIDMYKALEATAKVVTGRKDKELSANRELFISKLGLSDHHKDMLKVYVKYA